MKNIQKGSTLKHRDGFVWTITEITNNHISLTTSDTFGNIVNAGMSLKDLKSLISLGYYSIIN